MYLRVADMFLIGCVTLPEMVCVREKGQYTLRSIDGTYGAIFDLGLAYASNGPALPAIRDARYSVPYEPEFAAYAHIEGTTMMPGAAVSFPVAK
jgi:hypothetical protein